MKKINFRAELTDVSAKKEALVSSLSITSVHTKVYMDYYYVDVSVAMPIHWIGHLAS